MATNTYVALATQTVSSSVSSVTFSSIPQGYTDLRVVCNTQFSSGGSQYIGVQTGTGSIDTSSVYSNTLLVGDGSSAFSARDSNQTFMRLGAGTSTSSNFGILLLDFQNYSNATIYKTVIARDADVSQGWAAASVGMWRSTTAIDTIRILSGAGNNIAAGSTFTIYGIATVNQYTASTIPSTLKIGDVIRVTYTGSSQTLSIPAGVNTMQIEAAGASGGNPVGGTGGYGGWISGTYSLGGSATTMYAYVGGKGTDVGSSGGDLAGGFNGGGKGHFPTNTSNSGYAASAGGGGTDIRIGGTALANRIAVAGGGGGGDGYLLTGGYGGYPDGGFGSGQSSPDAFSGARGLGATQTAGGAGGAGATNGSNAGQSGSLGVGGDGGTTSYTYGQGGGGGGGYYGGGGGGSASNGGRTGGGGGSSYLGSLTDTRYYNGINLGDGYIILTVLS